MNQDGYLFGMFLIDYSSQNVESDKFSNILKVDLANNIITDTSNEDKVATDDKTEEETKKDYKNPETGAFLSMIPILVLSLISIVVWSKVKNKFVRI